MVVGSPFQLSNPEIKGSARLAYMAPILDEPLLPDALEHNLVQAFGQN